MKYRRDTRKVATSVDEFIRQWAEMVAAIDPAATEGIDLEGLIIALQDLAEGERVVDVEAEKLERFGDFLADLQKNVIGIAVETARKHPDFEHTGNLIGWLFKAERGSSLENPTLRQERLRALAAFIGLMADAMEKRFRGLQRSAEKREERAARKTWDGDPNRIEAPRTVQPIAMAQADEGAAAVALMARGKFSPDVIGAMREILTNPSAFSLATAAALHGTSATSLWRAFQLISRVAVKYIEADGIKPFLAAFLREITAA